MIASVVISSVGTLVAAFSVTTADAINPPRLGIVGGTRASTQEAPWAVAVANTSNQQLCGGALVAPTKVVTAAHCVVDPDTGQRRGADELEAIVGRNDLRTRRGMVETVQNVWVHPRYHDISAGDDVAVLTLRDPMSRRPVPMVGSGETDPYRAGTPGQVYGWGSTNELLSFSSVLRSVDVPVSSDSACRAAYGQQYDSNGMFCAGVPEGGRDACAGDSGGPFVVDGRLVGIVSFGVGCGRPDTPGVYTRLSQYADDINAQL